MIAVDAAGWVILAGGAAIFAVCAAAMGLELWRILRPWPTVRPPAPDAVAACPGCSRPLYAPAGHDPLRRGCPICLWGTE